MSQPISPEVQWYITQREQLQAFVAANSKFFEYYNDLVERHNTALQAAEKAARASGTTQGPFVLKSVRTSYDVDALYDAVGPERFIQLGGTLATVQERKLDKKRLEALIASNQLPKDLVDTIQTKTLQFTVPKEITLP